MQVKVVQFAKISGTGPQTIPGAGFTPIGVKFYWTRQTAVGFATGQEWGVGGASSPTEEAAFSTHSDDGASANWDLLENNRCIIMLQQSDGEPNEAAEFTAFTSDGCTINWITSSTNLWKITAVFFGSEDIVNIQFGTMALSVATGNIDITPVDFTPDFCMTAGDGPNLVLGVPKNKGQAYISVMESTSKRWNNSVVLKGQDGMADKTVTLYESDHVMTTRKKTTQYDNEADFVAFITNGIRINQTLAGMNASDHWFMMIEFENIGAVEVGTITKTTGGAPLNQTSPSIGFEGVAVLLTSSNFADGSDNANGEFATGISDIAVSSTHGVYSQDLFDDRDMRLLEDKAIQNSTVNGASPPTSDFEAEMNAINADDFVLRFTTNDSVASAIGYVVWGPKVINFIEVIDETENIGEAVNEVIGLIKVIDEVENLNEGIVSQVGIIRFANETVNISEFVRRPTFHLVGVSRSRDLTPLANVRLILLKHDGGAEAVRQYIIVGTINSDGSGDFDFTGLIDNQARLAVRAFDDASPDVRGTTNDDLQPVLE